ncbi:Fucose permease [Hathewaya proteolytica DSM 3090]|uniref:Fucose permease n=1 Tax=Hathewaya proteolytica DSM 3090 TaxID=1121331 RepID=A0A1M6TBU5_9CLOT|nr:MFS transporter [Hathewaya proteolytica]SHK54344.1 Fucose permease [Hathewaya proteolytica DSM 3090]
MNIKNKKFIKANIGIIIFMFLLMIINAVAENLKGIFLPYFKRDFGITDGIMGIWLFTGSMGYILFTYLGGLLSKKYGQKRVMFMGIILTIVSCISFYFSHSSRFMIFLDIFLINGGISLSTIAINTLIPIVGVGFQAVLMNLTHFFYGFGATLGTSTTGYLLNNSVKWQNIYLGVCIFYVIMVSVIGLIKVPSIRIVENDKNVIKKDNNSDRAIFSNGLMYGLAMSLGFYVFAETATINWLVNYCEKSFSMTVLQATKYLSLFTAVLTMGRLLGGFIVQKVGEFRTVLLFTVCAIILFTFGVVLGSGGIIMISLAGFFFSIIYPTLVLCAGKLFGSESAYVTGIIISLASGVNMILNVVMGYLNQILGPIKGFYIIPTSLCVSLAAQLYLRSKRRNIKNVS